MTRGFWILARGLTRLWRLVPLRGPGRLIDRLILSRGERFGETSTSLDEATALVRFGNPPETALYLWGFYEDEVSTVVRTALRPGSTAMDVGANCGILSLLMRTRVGPGGRVVSVDPSPAACQRVEAQAAANGFGNVQTVCAALEAEAGQDVYLSGAVGVGVLPTVDARYTTGEQVAVEVLTVDALVDQLALSDLALLKIDTDGSEVAILQGATETLGRHRPAIVFELYRPGLERRGGSTELLADLLGDAGYSLLRPRLEHLPRMVARPPRLDRFESLELESLTRGDVDGLNLVALHETDESLRRRLLRL